MNADQPRRGPDTLEQISGSDEHILAPLVGWARWGCEHISPAGPIVGTFPSPDTAPAVSRLLLIITPSSPVQPSRLFLLSCSSAGNRLNSRLYLSVGHFCTYLPSRRQCDELNPHHSLTHPLIPRSMDMDMDMGMGHGSMSMGNGVPGLFYLQKMYWAVIGSAIAAATVVNVLNRFLAFQR